MYCRSISVASLISLTIFTTAVAKADFISSTSTLPVIGVPYTSMTGVGCFPSAGVCALPGTLTLGTSTPSFNASGQDIVSNVTYIGALTDLANNPIGPLTLTGTIQQEVVGRTFSTETGSWTTDLLSLSLEGPLMGHTLTLVLDPSQTSSGNTSIVPLSDGNFRISSFFDVFVDLSIDSVPPLHAGRGPLELTLSPVSAVPEPATWTLLLLGFSAIGAMTCRRRRSAMLAA